MKPAAIVNLHAAAGRTGKLWPQIADHFDHMDVQFTRGPGHATELARACLKAGYDRIVAVGGDGTVHEVVNGWLDGDKPINPNATLAVLPLGTGSDYGRSLGIKDYKDALDLADAEGPFSPIDLGRVTYQAHNGGQETRLFNNVVSFGMGGEVALASKNVFSKIGGKAAFQYATAKVFLTYDAKSATLVLDGQPAGDFKITNIAIGIGRYHGGGMHVCPKSAMDDGLFEITIIHHLGAFTLAKDIKVLYSDNVYTHPKVDHYRAQHVIARTADKVSIEVDGEALGTLPLELTILPQVIRVARR
ncbi:MAG: diacylglycerol kinase family lipid kinase [Bryobacterales bacterium]|nr:diacylglycerol kinase family lipid kinase [Bryobacterales bacterium]